jgi:predicted nucleotidyltransferase
MTFDDLVKSLKVQPELNGKLWNSHNQLYPEIRGALLKIAKMFYTSITLETKPKVLDVVFTGSLANYNYSDLSDIDLHLIFNFTEIDADLDLAAQFFILAKANWNEQHNITVKGYEVEVYAEDKDNAHVSTGLYSVLNDKWIKEPHKDHPIYDVKDVNSKMQYFVVMYNELLKQFKQKKFDRLYERIVLLRDKIKRFRQSGLRAGGVHSTENITFKFLRRVGLLEKLKLLQNKVLDKQLSVEAQHEEYQLGKSRRSI